MSKAEDRQHWCSAAIDGVDAVAKGVIGAALLGELGVVVVNVLARILVHRSFLWADEAARIALSTMAFIGGAVAYRRGEHAIVRVLLNTLPDGGRRACLALADVLTLVIAGIVAVVSCEFLQSSWGEATPILQIPAATIALPLTLGLVLIGLFALDRLWREHGARGGAVCGGVTLVVVGAIASRPAWSAWMTADGALVFMLALFFLLILCGVPVGFVLMVGMTLYLWSTASAPLVVIPQSMVTGTGNFILLAIPFFIFAGLIMERGGISLRLVSFVRTLVGHVRGGILQVAVVSMYIVSGLSGSKPADVAAVGTVLRDEIHEQHGPAEGSAVLAACAIMGETVPPSIAMLIVGSITNLSVAALFIGGFLPAVVIALCLMALIYVRALRAGRPRARRAPARLMLSAGVTAIPGFLLPAMLIVGIVGGFTTPTEVAAFAVMYGLLLAMGVYRAMDRRTFWRTVVDTASLCGMMLFIIAAATSFSWTLTVALLPQKLLLLLHAVRGSAVVFMLSSIVLIIAAGILLEGLPALNVLAPLMLPMAGQMGLSEVHYALVLIIGMGCGAFMPLTGVGFWIVCAIMGSEIEDSSRAMVPYILVVLTGLLVVAFVPWFSLLLPHYFGFRG